MTAKDIALTLSWSHFDRFKQYVLPNLTTFVIGEADLVALYPSGWMDEVEIKISKSDFRREFLTKAEKHDRLTKGIPAYKSIEDGFDPENPLHVAGAPWWDGKPHDFHDWSETTPHVIRRFWFAMPIELAKELLPEIPEHAGLIGIRKGAKWDAPEVLRKAPILKHSRKLTDRERMKLLDLAYQRYWTLRRGLDAEKASQLEVGSRKATTTTGSVTS